MTSAISALLALLLAASSSAAEPGPGPGQEPEPPPTAQIQAPRADSLVLRAGECHGTIVGDGTRGPYRLPCAHANLATMSVTLRGDLLAPGVGYVLDLDTQTLTLRRRLRAGEEVELRYEAFPFDLQHTLIQIDPDSIPEPDESMMWMDRMWFHWPQTSGTGRSSARSPGTS